MQYVMLILINDPEEWGPNFMKDDVEAEINDMYKKHSVCCKVLNVVEADEMHYDSTLVDESEGLKELNKIKEKAYKTQMKRKHDIRETDQAVYSSAPTLTVAKLKDVLSTLPPDMRVIMSLFSLNQGVLLVDAIRETHVAGGTLQLRNCPEVVMKKE